MSPTDPSTTPQPFYRIDRFVVPQAVRAEFIGRVRMTHEVLRQQPGFIQDMLVEQPAGPGQSKIITIVEWRDVSATDGARAAVAAMYSRENFSAQTFIAERGIDADFGNYQPLGV